MTQAAGTVAPAETADGSPLARPRAAGTQCTVLGAIGPASSSEGGTAAHMPMSAKLRAGRQGL